MNSIDLKSLYVFTYFFKVWYVKAYLTSFQHQMEAAIRSCSVKKVFLKISQNSPENTTCARATFSNKVAGLQLQVFSYEFCKILVFTFLVFTFSTGSHFKVLF